MQEGKLSVVIETVFDKCIAPKARGAGCDNMTMILVLLKSSKYFRDVLTKEHQPHPSEHQSKADCSLSEA